MEERKGNNLLSPLLAGAGSIQPSTTCDPTRALDTLVVRVQGGEVKRGRGEIVLGWGERWIQRGEDGEKKDDENGQLATRVQGDTWPSAMTKCQV